LVSPDEVLAFWLDELEPTDWFRSDPAFDEQIRQRFHSTWEAATEGALALWLTYPSGSLAYIILNDQLSRNMFRGDAQAFSTDELSLAAAKMAIERKWDMRIDPPARVFFYMPLVHSEYLSDQDRAVRLICTRMPDQGGAFRDHARAHRSIIRDFGRFPYRNVALGRKTTLAEQAFLDGGGYGAVMRAQQAGEGSSAPVD